VLNICIAEKYFGSKLKRELLALRQIWECLFRKMSGLLNDALRRLVQRYGWTGRITAIHSEPRYTNVIDYTEAGAINNPGIAD